MDMIIADDQAAYKPLGKRYELPSFLAADLIPPPHREPHETGRDRAFFRCQGGKTVEDSRTKGPGEIP
jgi:hypothetical protein